MIVTKSYLAYQRTFQFFSTLPLYLWFFFSLLYSTDGSFKRIKREKIGQVGRNIFVSDKNEQGELDRFR